MEEFESPPATKEQNLGTRLAVLGESVEKEVEALFGGYELREPVETKFAKLNFAQQTLFSHRKNVEKTAQRESSRVVTANLAADHREKEAAAIEPAAQLLSTSDLPPLNGNQTRIIHKVVSILPGLQPEKHIKVELATELGFEEVELEALQPIAEKIGHPFFREGLPDFRILSNPEEQFFLATLAALAKAYDTGRETFPVSRFAELPVDDMKALHDLFRGVLAKRHPHLHANANYKGKDLRQVAEEVLRKANAVRREAGTDLFGKALSKTAQEGKELGSWAEAIDSLPQ